ncbi:MAG: LytTR family transcriptional regulator [Flavobacterium sp.]|nr:LytTR family transcriptional regulator [Flavobacterium sp.]
MTTQKPKINKNNINHDAHKTTKSRDILFLRGDINYRIPSGGWEEGDLSSTLLRHQERLEGFLRVSRKHLVNPEYIKQIESNRGVRQVLMFNGERIAVARRRKIHFK